MPSTTITFSSPGALPPIFIAGSFTEPAWKPEELEHDADTGESTGSKTGLTELKFYKTFDIPVGQWQYKFRLGQGDWWVCDKYAEVVTDEHGNQNNVLLVETASTSDTKDDEKVVGHKTITMNGDQHTWDSTDQHSRKHCHIVGHFNPNCSTKGVSACRQEEQARGEVRSQEISAEQIEMVKQALSTPIIQELPPNDLSNLEQVDDVLGPAMRRPILGHARTFSHETLSYAQEEVSSVSLGVPSLDGLDDSPASDEPSPVEAFPQDKRGILERIHTTKLFLEPDETIPSMNAPQPLPLDASDVSPRFSYEYPATLPCLSHEGSMDDESDMEMSLDSSVPQMAGLDTIATSVALDEEKHATFYEFNTDSHEFLLGHDGANSRKTWSRAASTDSNTTATTAASVIENGAGESILGSLWRRIAEWFNSILYRLFVNKEA